MVEVGFDFFVKLVGWPKQDYYVAKATEAILNGQNTISIPEEDYEEAKQVLSERQKADERLASVAGRNTDGIQLEKEGRVEEAIALYENNIADGYPATHSFDRLMKIYRKQKDYENEVRVIRRAIEVFSLENKKRAKHSIEQMPKKEAEIRNALNTCNKVMGDNGLYCFVPYDVAAYTVRLNKALALLEK